MGQQRKTEMRKDMKKVLANLDKRWQAVAHVEVCRRVIEVIHHETERSITDVLAWIPSFPGEVDLAGVIAEMLKTRDVYLPRVVSPGEMEFIKIDSDWAMNLEQGKHGVQQPRAGYGETLDGSRVGSCWCRGSRLTTVALAWEEVGGTTTDFLNEQKMSRY
jgi:5-formyltetrahydrofolate cyclo-ligase